MQSPPRDQILIDLLENGCLKIQSSLGRHKKLGIKAEKSKSRCLKLKTPFDLFPFSIPFIFQTLIQSNKLDRSWANRRKNYISSLGELQKLDWVSKWNLSKWFNRFFSFLYDRISCLPCHTFVWINYAKCKMQLLLVTKMIPLLVEWLNEWQTESKISNKELIQLPRMKTGIFFLTNLRL